MQPTPIPDDEVFPDHRRIVIGPPRGHDLTGDIHAVEAQVSSDPMLGTFIRTRWMPTAEELRRLNEGEPLWLTIWGRAMPPVDIAMTEPHDGGP